MQNLVDINDLLQKRREVDEYIIRQDFNIRITRVADTLYSFIEEWDTTLLLNNIRILMNKLEIMEITSIVFFVSQKVMDNILEMTNLVKLNIVSNYQDMPVYIRLI